MFHGQAANPCGRVRAIQVILFLNAKAKTCRLNIANAHRLLTDQLAELLFTPSRMGMPTYSVREWVAAQIHCTGNVMIDMLVRLSSHDDTLPTRAGFGGALCLPEAALCDG